MRISLLWAKQMHRYGCIYVVRVVFTNLQMVEQGGFYGHTSMHCTSVSENLSEVDVSATNDMQGSH